MGRKIPGKKHHGVKDPEKQAKVRFDKIKTKINTAPTILDDDQGIPKKLRFIARARQDVKDGKTYKKEKDTRTKEEKQLLDSSKHMGREMRLPGMKRSLKPIPVFKQKPGENSRKFINRMEKQVQQVLKQKVYEQKYDVDIVRDAETGQTKIQDREKDELELETDAKKAAKKAKRTGVVVRTKEEKRQLKRLNEKEKKWKKKRKLNRMINADGDAVTNEDFQKDFESERFVDEVGFGEVAMAPPSIKRLKDRKPGAKVSSLLLAKKLRISTNKMPVDSSLAKKSMLEAERDRVIEEYRALKMNRLNKVKM